MLLNLTPRKLGPMFYVLGVETKARWRTYGPELRLILWALWDPIAAGVPLDEYDSYAPSLWQLLSRGASEAETAAQLEAFRTVNMGLDADPESDNITASRLASWWYLRFADDE